VKTSYAKNIMLLIRMLRRKRTSKENKKNAYSRNSRKELYFFIQKKRKR